MATGYTYPVAEGKETFNSFVWSCARSFGALFELRDSNSPKIEIDKLCEPNTTYYDKELITLVEELDYINSVSFENAKANLIISREKQNKYREERLQNIKKAYNNYKSMLDIVQNWRVPSNDHFNLKKFMINQLEESIKDDCNNSYIQKEVSLDVTNEDVRAYIENEKKTILSSIENTKNNIKKEIDSCSQKKQWLLQLAESVGYPTTK